MPGRTITGADGRVITTQLRCETEFPLIEYFRVSERAKMMDPAFGEAVGDCMSGRPIDGIQLSSTGPAVRPWMIDAVNTLEQRLQEQTARSTGQAATNAATVMEPRQDTQ